MKRFPWASPCLSVSRFRGRKGAAAVEFAVVAPVMLVLVLGLIELGRAMMISQVATDAAREGCRLAIRASTTSEVTNYVRTYVREALGKPALEDAAIKVEISSASPPISTSSSYTAVTDLSKVPQASAVRVKVTLDFKVLSSGLPVNSFMSKEGNLIPGLSTMRREVQ